MSMLILFKPVWLNLKNKADALRLLHQGVDCSIAAMKLEPVPLLPSRDAGMG